MAKETTERPTGAVGSKGSPAKRAPAQREKKAPARIIPSRLLILLGLVMLGVLALLAGSLFMTGRRDNASAGGGSIGILKASDYHSLTFSPGNPNVLFFGHHDGIMGSSDGGRTWRTVVEKRNFDAMNIAFNRNNPSQLFIAGHDVFQTSTDGGATWQPVVNNLPGTDLHAFTMSSTDPNRLYVFSVDNGVFQSTDGGHTWQPVGGGKLPSDITALASLRTGAGGNPETLFVGSMSGGLLRSTDGGKTWASSTNGLGSQGVRALAVDPTSPKVIYAGAADGLYRSTDSGASWSKLAFPGADVVAIAAQPNIVEVIGIKDRDGLVYRSEDGGATWVPR